MIRQTKNSDLINELNKTNLHIDSEITYADLHNPINTTGNCFFFL